MMTYCVFISFDLESRSEKDFEAVKLEMENFGFHNYIDSKKCHLPKNIFAGKYSDSSPATARDNICSQVENVFTSCNVQGKIFVAVAESWIWGIRFIGE